MQHLSKHFADRVTESFKRESLTAGRFSTDYSFKGAKTIEVFTPKTVPMSNYTRSGSGRYGTVTEMEDVVQELTLSRDRGFAFTVDKGNNMDQNMLKNAVKMLALQVSEQAIPEMDAYVLAALCQQAGCVVADSEKTTKSNICEKISVATQHLDDAEVPANDRTLFVSAAGYKLLKHSDEFLAVDALAREALRVGIVGRYDNMEVVKVPAARWPKNVNFIVAHKHAATAPVKISDTNIHQDPPGISGALIEGRQYYDLFVFGARADGVYVSVDTSADGVVCALPTIGAAGALNCATEGAVIKYTTDGTDPRYSPTAKSGSQSDVTTGCEVKAYACKEGAYPSAVASAVLA